MKKSISAKMIIGLIEKQEFRCALSNRQLQPGTASLDHIVPVSRGGTHDLENLWVIQHLVNTAKGTLTVDEFIAMCRDVAKHQSEASDQTNLGTWKKTLLSEGPTEEPLY